MACPKCGGSDTVITSTYSVVKVAMHHCHPCERIFRVCSIDADLTKQEYQAVWRIMSDAQAYDPKPNRQAALKYLENHIHAMLSGRVVIRRKLRDRMADHLDREFLKDALGDDYEP